MPFRSNSVAVNDKISFFFVTEQYSIVCVFMYMDFPSSSEGKESACDSEDPGSVPG